MGGFRGWENTVKPRGNSCGWRYNLENSTQIDNQGLESNLGAVRWHHCVSWSICMYNKWCADVWLTLRNGTIPSLAMACRSRGAPVKLWSPAPQVEKKEPKTMTQGDGHANVPITRFPLTASPNLPKCTHKHKTLRENAVVNASLYIHSKLN